MVISIGYVIVMMRGMPGGRHDALVESPVGWPAAAFARCFWNILAYSGVSGGFWPAPGGTPGVQPMPPWLIQMPVKSRRFLRAIVLLAPLRIDGLGFGRAGEGRGQLGGIARGRLNAAGQVEVDGAVGHIHWPLGRGTSCPAPTFL